jgi:hypothetical protein
LLDTCSLQGRKGLNRANASRAKAAQLPRTSQSGARAPRCGVAERAPADICDQAGREAGPTAGWMATDPEPYPEDLPEQGAACAPVGTAHSMCLACRCRQLAPLRLVDAAGIIPDCIMKPWCKAKSTASSSCGTNSSCCTRRQRQGLLRVT